MRTHEQLISEIKFRKENNLPRIELTPEERARAFGDVVWSQTNRNQSRLETMVERYNKGVPLSLSDKKEVRQYLRGK
jgi:hypothetical protein